MLQKREGKFDVVIVGAGLSGCLLAWFLKLRVPAIKILLLESGTQIQPQRTWSFHGTDVGENLSELNPLIDRSWSGYDVRFPSFSRKLDGSYHTITPGSLSRAVNTLLGDSLRFSAEVIEISSESVKLRSGECFHASCVIDSRGATKVKNCGFQKFVGQRVQLRGPHYLIRPLLMDATVKQLDGYRFFYLLPYSENELLVEDTRYSNNPALSFSDYLSEIEEYIKRRGWQVDSIIDTESGVLPIPLGPPTDSKFFNEIPRIGMAGGYFHPVTSYSLPDAVRLAVRIADLPIWTSASVVDCLKKYARERSTLNQYFYVLNRMMFLAAEPEKRYRIFEHFYRMPEKTIQNFYEGSMSVKDRLLLLSGRPPVPVFSAVRSLFSRSNVGGL